MESAVESVVEDPHFRLPTQPKVVEGWGGTGEAADPLLLVVGEGGGEGVAINRTEDAGSEGGEAAGGAGLSPGAVHGKNKKGAAENSTQKRRENTGSDAGDAGDDSDGDQKDTEAEKDAEKEEKNRRNEKRKKEMRQVGVPKIAQRRTKIAQRRKKTSRGQGNGGFTEDRR